VDKRRSDGKSMFLQMLKEHCGEVHFLYFWRAFSKAVRLVGGGEEGRGTHESLLTEFETLRDRMLRLLDTQASENGGRLKQPTMSGIALHEILQSTLSMSAAPTFWQRCIASLASSKDDSRLLHLEHLTMMMLQWLYDAVTWHPPITSQISRCEETQGTGRKRLAVRLHIYDVSRDDSIQQINQVFARRDSPLKFGGAFHVGVEVNNTEWCFGFTTSETRYGVHCVMPRRHPNHHFRQTVFMGYTHFSAEDIADLVSNLIEEYPGNDYDLLARNCCHFADDFCQRLGVGPTPGWIHRFADIGVYVVGMLQTASIIRVQVDQAVRQAGKDLHNGQFNCWEPPRTDSIADFD